MKTCDFCEKNGITQVDETFDLYIMLLEYLNEHDVDSVSVVADEETTKQLLYHAINDECSFNEINLDHYDYDDAYITTISDKNDDYEIIIAKARYNDGKYLATDDATFIQYNLPCKCQYIEDVINNKFVKGFNPQFFQIGKIEECNEPKTHTYADHFEDEGFSSDIYVESTSKEVVDAIKKVFGKLYIKD